MVPDFNLIRDSICSISKSNFIFLISNFRRLPMAQAIFEPNLFCYEYSLHFLNIVTLHVSAYEDGTECSETSAYKIQTPGK